MTIEEIRPREVSLNLAEAQGAIAAEVRAELARQKVSETALASRLGKNQQWLSRRCLGLVPFAGHELLLIADYLGVPIEKLYGRYWPTRPASSGKLLRLDSNQEPAGSRPAALKAA